MTPQGEVLAAPQQEQGQILPLRLRCPCASPGPWKPRAVPSAAVPHPEELISHYLSSIDVLCKEMLCCISTQ